MTISVAILGASGYAGGELVRILLRHPFVSIHALTAERNAGKAFQTVFPSFHPHISLPPLIALEELSFKGIDVVFCALPHGQTQQTIQAAFKENPALKIIDLSADFRLNDPDMYQRHYQTPHLALGLQKEAVYGLSEYFRAEIKAARLVANPGCYPTASLLALMPLLKGDLIEVENIIIDAKSGVSGAGRKEKQGLLYAEMSSGISAYSVGVHRHGPEIDEYLSFSATQNYPIKVHFTPHLLPINRGILSTCYVKIKNAHTIEDLRDHLTSFYKEDFFVQITKPDYNMTTIDVRGSNHCRIGIFPTQREGHAVVISVIDNLLKGASGQAVQNMNLMMGFDETEALRDQALFL